MSPDTARIGFWTAILSVVFAAMFSVVALAATFTGLIPELWVNPASFAPSLALAWSFLALMVCVTELAPYDARIWSRLGLAFAAIYATINTLVYFTQLAVVSPRLFAGNGESVAVLQFTSNSFMQSANGFAYGLMSVAALLSSQNIAGLPEAKFVRLSMIAHGVIAPFIIGALFWPTLTIIGAFWITTFPTTMVALALEFRRAPAVRGQV